MVNGGGKLLDWYLMKTNDAVPVTSCEESEHCIEQIQTTEGVAEFKRHILETNAIYYVCAKFVDEGGVIHEVCGNGIVVDSDPPVPGSVTVVHHHNGFITRTDAITVMWEGFSDIERMKHIDILSGVETYLVSIGNYVSNKIC